MRPDTGHILLRLARDGAIAAATAAADSSADAEEARDVSGGSGLLIPIAHAKRILTTQVEENARARCAESRYRLARFVRGDRSLA